MLAGSKQGGAGESPQNKTKLGGVKGQEVTRQGDRSVWVGLGGGGGNIHGRVVALHQGHELRGELDEPVAHAGRRVEERDAGVALARHERGSGKKRSRLEGSFLGAL